MRGYAEKLETYLTTENIFLIENVIFSCHRMGTLLLLSSLLTFLLQRLKLAIHTISYISLFY